MLIGDDNARETFDQSIHVIPTYALPTFQSWWVKRPTLNTLTLFQLVRIAGNLCLLQRHRPTLVGCCRRASVTNSHPPLIPSWNQDKWIHLTSEWFFGLAELGVNPASAVIVEKNATAIGPMIQSISSKPTFANHWRQTA